MSETKHKVCISYHVNTKTDPCADGIMAMWAACIGLYQERERRGSQPEDILTILGATKDDVTLYAATYEQLAALSGRPRTHVYSAAEEHHHLIYVDCVPVFLTKTAADWWADPNRLQDPSSALRTAGEHIRRWLRLGLITPNGGHIPNTTIYIADHHQGAFENVWHLKELIEQLNSHSNIIPCELKIEVMLDAHKSGAALARDMFSPHLEKSYPGLIEHIQDYDLWTHKLADSEMWTYLVRRVYQHFVVSNETAISSAYAAVIGGRLAEDLIYRITTLYEVCSAEASGYYAMNRHRFDGGSPYERRKQEWELYKRERDLAVKIAASRAEWYSPYAHSNDGMMIVQVHEHGNEVADLLLKNERVVCVCCVYLAIEGPVRLSFRSRKDGGVDVRELAKAFGGGGHASAAGGRFPDKVAGGTAPVSPRPKDAVRAIKKAYTAYRRGVGEQVLTWSLTQQRYVPKAEAKANNAAHRRRRLAKALDGVPVGKLLEHMSK